MNLVRTMAVTSLFAVQLSAAPLTYKTQNAVKANPAPALKAQPVAQPAAQPLRNPAAKVQPVAKVHHHPAAKAHHPAAKVHHHPAIKAQLPATKAPLPAAKAPLPAVKPHHQAVHAHPAAKAHNQAHAHGKKVSHHGKKAGAKDKKLRWGKSSSSSSSSSSSFFPSSSSSSSDAYDGAYTQNLELGGEFNPAALDSVLVPITGPVGTTPAAAAITFNTNEPGSPNHITHPVGTDFTRFRIEKSGVYLINWTFTVGCLGAYESENTCLNGFFVQLFDAANNVALNPNPFEFVDTENFAQIIDSEVVAGQQLIKLNKGVELQLRVIPQTFNCSSLWIANPSFTVVRVD